MTNPFTNEEWIHVKTHYEYGGSKPLYVGEWTQVREPRIDESGMWNRVVMDPEGELYINYYDNGKHELWRVKDRKQHLKTN